MTGGSGGRKRLWRWRSNPLRRRADLVEAWVVLAVWAVVAVGGTLAGLVTAHAAGDVLARQRAERHSARAVLLTAAPAAAQGEAASDRITARVRWTADDGTTRTGTTLVKTGQKAGAEVVVWLDGRGGLAPEPPSRTEANLEVALLGTAAALAVAGAVTGAGALTRWRLERRRVAQWGTEWDLVGPQWGHTTT